ncbi:MAG: segregation/condensation protein A [Acidimicrobiia bacterium]|nr:segregation/condensation protein A [Acidimicrobiia bacterium]
MAVMVRTAHFEGPLELLMHLVLRHEIDVCDISLAALVQDFLDEVARMESLDLESASEFLLTASTLVDLKSRKLLPEPATEGVDEEADLLDGRDRLLARMLECETFRRAGAALERLAEVAALSSPRAVGPEARYLNLLPDLLADVEPADVAAACARALRATEPPNVDLSHMADDTLQVSDVVADLVQRLPAHRRTTFGELTQALPGRREVVVHFLALLELFKQNRVELHQDGPLGRIVVEWREQAATPALRVLETVA